MKIALIGYGRMGHEIEAVAIERGHEIVLRITEENLADFNTENLQKADVAIEFSQPEAAPGNVSRCLEAGTPVVSGTTGWNDQLAAAEKKCKLTGTAFIHASNFSLGVNIFFSLNEQLASIMQRFSRYEPSITEIHHTRKLDAPSGTAITLAEAVLKNVKRKNKWTLEKTSNPGELQIHAIREGDVPGTHTVQYSSNVDDIIITHQAHNRKGFALGAVIAAEYLPGKKGVFTMRDVLQLND